METKTKIILGLVGAGVATLVIYMMARRRSSGAQMPAPVVSSAPVPVINYSNNKPVMGLGAFRDGATGKPSMSGQSDQKPRMGEV